MWRPEAGKRAWFVDSNVDVLRVYKGGTATIQYWGRNLSEGKLVTQRGVRRSSLSAPRRRIDGEYIREEPVLRECDQCGGCGQMQAECANCGIRLTNYNVAREDDESCQKCAASC